MTTITAHVINEVVTSKVITSLEAKDTRGRLIGAQITRMEADWIDSPEDAKWGYCTDRRGHWFAFKPWATRDGKTYGASQSVRWFATEIERDKAISDYIASAQKRANKKAK